MRLRPKVKELLPKIAEAIISIEIEGDSNRKVGRPPLSMHLVLESILFVLTEGCSWRAIDRPQAHWNSVYQYFRRWCQRALASSRRCLVRWEPSRHLSLAEELTECLVEGSTLIGDKAYDSSTLRQTAATKGIKTCIPARTNRTTTVPFSATVYRRRHRVENFFERIKRYRRVATRYDKLAETFLGFVCLAILFTLRLT